MEFWHYDGYLPPGMFYLPAASNPVSTQVYQAPRVLSAKSNINSKTVGLGLTLREEQGLYKIDLVKQGSPCEPFVKPGEFLIAINHETLQGKSFIQVAEIARGNADQNVVLRLMKENEYRDAHFKRQWNFISLKERVEMGFKKRDPTEIEKRFAEYRRKISDPDRTEKERDPKRNLLEALKSFDVVPDIHEEDCCHINEIFKRYDLNSDGEIDLDEFTFAVHNHFPIPDWTQAVPVESLFADCLPRYAGNNHILEPKHWSDDLIGESIKAFSDGLHIMLRNLKKTWLETNLEDLKLDPKLQCGTIDDFHKGLIEIVGHPHLQFYKSMESEHCKGLCSKNQFTTSNNGITTTPFDEWNLVHHPEHLQTLSTKERAKNRCIKSIDELMVLRETTEAELIKAEVVGVVLYSGPMYQIYNSIMRRDGDIYKEFKENLFSTTISVVASAVKKISRIMKLQPGLILYRGLGKNTGLPDHFFDTDAHGCVGFTEYGFMSTTSKKDVAVLYSKADEGIVGAKVLKIEVLSVDRGACIQCYSQYPNEVEYLYLPCSFVQKAGPMTREKTKINGRLYTVIPVRIDSNLQIQTVDQLLQEKKGLHMSAFRHLIGEVREELKVLKDTDEVKARLIEEEDGTADSVDEFVSKIEVDCFDVLTQHNVVPLKKFANSSTYRSLVLGMLDVKKMATSKFCEWVDNRTSSLSQRFAWELRSSHQIYIAFLEREHKELREQKCQTLNAERDRAKKLQQSAVKLCRLAGLIVDDATEVTDFGETRIMVAAEEGASSRVFKLLVDAQADVTATRKDGATPVWLAAKFGHAKCIRVLIELKACVDSPSNTGATTVYIAAQNGHIACINELVQLGAKVDTADMDGETPLDQAIRYRHNECAERLKDLMKVSKTSDIGVKSNPEKPKKDKKLIISSGNLSDVDGFFALAEYAKTEADVLFILNYPAYIGVSSTALVKQNKSTDDVKNQEGDFSKTEFWEDYRETDEMKLSSEEIEDRRYAWEHPGLGFKYGADKVIEREADRSHRDFKFYMEIIEARRPCRQAEADGHQRFDAIHGDLTSMKECIERKGDGPSKEKDEDNITMKAALTDVAFAIATKVWQESAPANTKKGDLLFAIGGVNTINPFSRDKIINEVLLFAPLLKGTSLKNILPKGGSVYDSDGLIVDFNFNSYSDAVMDFCGSLSFWDEGWERRIRRLHEKGSFKVAAGGEAVCSAATGQCCVKAAFVMGGVLTDQYPVTLPSIKGVLNRFSSATMNQLFNPQASGHFFSFLGQYRVPTYVVTNNAVKYLRESRVQSDDQPDLIQFLEQNNIGGDFTRNLADVYYSNFPNRPQKPFDFYVALAVAAFLRGEMPLRGHGLEKRYLFYDSTYGITFVSAHPQWEEAKAEYLGQVEQLCDLVDHPAKEPHSVEGLTCAVEVQAVDGLARKVFESSLHDPAVDECKPAADELHTPLVEMSQTCDRKERQACEHQRLAREHRREAAAIRSMDHKASLTVGNLRFNVNQVSKTIELDFTLPPLARGTTCPNLEPVTDNPLETSAPESKHPSTPHQGGRVLHRSETLPENSAARRPNSGAWADKRPLS